MPAFRERAMVQIEYRDGQQCNPEFRPWTFTGWEHTGSRGDIVAYRITNDDDGVLQEK